MTIHAVTLDEKIHLIGRMIAAEKKAGRSTTVLSAIHADLEARSPHAPSVALVELDRRINIMKRSKIPGIGYGNGQMVSVAQEVVSRWSVLRQALEMFGAAIEEDVVG